MQSSRVRLRRSRSLPLRKQSTPRSWCARELKRAPAASSSSAPSRLRQSSVLSKCLPSASTIEAGEGSSATGGSSRERHRVVIDAIAENFAVNTVSVYDWLTGLPRGLAMSPLHELEGLRRDGLYRAV